MKLCWDNIEGLRYNKKIDKWEGCTKSNNRMVYEYVEECKACGEPFLSRTGNKGIFCCGKCANGGKNSPSYGKKRSKEKETKKKKEKKETYEGMKICSKCNKKKDFSEFYKSKRSEDGYNVWCKECSEKYQKSYREKNKEKSKEYHKNYSKNNSEYLKEKSKNYYKDNKQSIIKRVSNYQKTITGREACLKYNRKYRQTDKAKKVRENWLEKNRERYLKLKRERYRKNKINHLMSGSIRGSINDKNGTHWECLVDFTLEELKEHLESKFQPGMTWDNHGKWHIDHIRPIASFNITSYKDEDFKKCWCLENLQPLWAKDNLSKGAKWYGELRTCIEYK